MTTCLHNGWQHWLLIKKIKSLLNLVPHTLICSCSMAITDSLIIIASHPKSFLTTVISNLCFFAALRFVFTVSWCHFECCFLFQLVQWACQGRLVDLEFLFSCSLLLTPYSAFLHYFDPIPGLLGISQYDVISNKRFMWHHSTHLVLQEALQHCTMSTRTIWENVFIQSQCRPRRPPWWVEISTSKSIHFSKMLGNYPQGFNFNQSG